MLAVSHIEDFLDIVGIIDYNLNLKKLDDAGDFIEVFDTDITFSDLRDAVLRNRKMRNLIVDNGTDFLEIKDTIYIDGYASKVNILCANRGVGISIKLKVRTVEFPVDGELKTFLGFDAVSRYLENHKRSEDA